MRHQAGKYIDDRYLLQDVVDSGGFSEVWRAKDTEKNTQDQAVVAIKLPHTKSHSRSEVEERFDREYRSLNSLSNGVAPQTVVRFYDGKASPSPYIVTEFLSGLKLSEALSKDISPGSREAVRIGRLIARTIAYLHYNDTLYLDLKPDNVLLKNTTTPILIDFNTTATISTGDSTVFHADSFKPPEQTPPGEPTDIEAHTDVYAVGAVLYKLYTGKTPDEGNYPYNGLDPTKIGNSSCPKPVADVISRATARQPTQRYQDGIKLYSALVESQMSETEFHWLSDVDTGTNLLIRPDDTVGRFKPESTSAMITIPDQEGYISPTQFRFEYTMGQWELHDTSTNGTYVYKNNQWNHIISADGKRKLQQNGVLSESSKLNPSIELTDGDLISPVDPEYEYTFKFGL